MAGLGGRLLWWLLWRLLQGTVATSTAIGCRQKLKGAAATGCINLFHVFGRLFLMFLLIYTCVWLIYTFFDDCYN
jgi:hypothetical protein